MILEIGSYAWRKLFQNLIADYRKKVGDFPSARELRDYFEVTHHVVICLNDENRWGHIELRMENPELFLLKWM